jgi:gas vesicle protein
MWLLIGAAVGAGIAMLYAPKSGKDTRRLLRRKAEDARDAIAETTGQIRDKVVTTGETIADAGRDVYRKAGTAASAAAGLFEASKRVVSR